jgi:hypothetical protein
MEWVNRMRYITLVFFSTISFLMLCRSAGGEGYFSSSAAEAIVDKNEALFKFPLNPREHYEWGPWGLQYAWYVEVANNNQVKYELGFSIYGSMSYEPFFSGDIRKLLRAGYFGLWGSGAGTQLEGVSQNGRVKSGGTGNQPIVEKSIVSGYATQKKLIIRLQGERTIRKVFANQPTEVSFSRHMFAMSEGYKPVTIRVPVIYTKAFLSTKMRKTFVENGYKLLDRSL